MHLSLSELVQILQELDHVGPAAGGEGDGWLVVLEVLLEGVPVPALLGLVAAQLRRGRR